MFELAIKELYESDSYVSRPESFQNYKKRANIKIKNIRTAQMLSIYAIKDLQKELFDANCTIFRLGSPKGESYTHFAIAKYYNDWSDYFLIDDDIFSNNEVQYVIDNKEVKYLFKLLQVLSESALVNLSLASGVLYKALNIKTDYQNIIPAVSAGSFTFDFKPLSNSNCRLTHHQGQVEIDSFFIAERNNIKNLFIVEAKLTNKKIKGKKRYSLAKHKLLYPILAMKNNIPSTLNVIPVYIRFIINNNSSINIHIIECSIPRVKDEFGALDQLKPIRSSNYNINL